MKVDDIMNEGYRVSKEDEALEAEALKTFKKILLGKKLKAFGKDSRQLWSKVLEVMEFTVTKIEVPYASTKSDNGFVSVNVYLDKSYDSEKLGLIYTDDRFITSVRDELKAAGLETSGNIVGYSEQGMQGDDYVNLDVSFYKLALHMKEKL